jgi:hypothetical protein
MGGVDPKICCHKLALKPGAILVAKKKRWMSPDRAKAIEKQVKRY